MRRRFVQSTHGRAFLVCSVSRSMAGADRNEGSAVALRSHI
jgi:hypothetical protein